MASDNPYYFNMVAATHYTVPIQWVGTRMEKQLLHVQWTLQELALMVATLGIYVTLSLTNFSHTQLPAIPIPTGWACKLHHLLFIPTRLHDIVFLITADCSLQHFMPHTSKCGYSGCRCSPARPVYSFLGSDSIISCRPASYITSLPAVQGR